MIIRLKNYLIALSIIILLALPALADKSTLIVGTAPNYPPFSYIKNGKIIGFNIDLINVIATSLGYTLEIKNIDFQNLLDSLRSKEVDIVISSITPTHARRQTLDFSSRYYFPKYAILHLRDKDINSENDLNGKVIGVLANTSMEAALKARLAPQRQMKVQSFSSRDLALDALSAGEIDVMLDENKRAEILKQNNKQITYFIMTSAHPDGHAIVFQKNSELLDVFNEEIAKLKSSKQLEKLQTKWGLK